VLAGQENWHGADARRAAGRSGASDRIHFTGFVSDDDLLYLYNASEFFVFPSFYEGFGLPVLEAMACARAVACSKTSAVHEVADAAAILFDPESIDDMARAMRDLALNPDLCARMERLAVHRAGHFSWRNTAQRTLDVYCEVAAVSSAAVRVSSASVLDLL
jgi:glycosyltransferase involved in cell wall biosynthesis